MKENKDRVRLMLLILFILIGCISSGIVFSAITSNLRIDGFATIGRAKWSIKFINLENAILTGGAEEIRKPTIQSNSASIGSFDVKFTATNDSVIYYFEVINDGDLDAKLSSITMPKPACVGKGSNKMSDEELVCKNLKYQLTYADGKSINVSDELIRGTKKKMKLYLRYVGDGLPQNEVNVSGLGISMIYGEK